MGHAYSKSGPEIRSRDLFLIAAAVLVGSTIYLVFSALTYRIGFPLDDAWIHEAYARNLAEHGQWAFQAGHPSAGSTAPLWTLLLTPGFWLHLGPIWWSYVLGACLLFALALAAEVAVRRLDATYRPRMPWVGIFIATEWHMVWAALSGMETVLQALLITLVLGLLLTGSRRYLGLGLLSGVSIWVRPDGLTLLGPVLLTIFLVHDSWVARGRALVAYLLGLGALLLPYLLLNLWLSHTPMPNTFYAKQAEYAAWQARPLLERAGVVTIQLFTGPGVLLLPGVVLYAIRILRDGRWPMLAPILWSASYMLLYMLRLPTYQHARYLMPAMPVLMLFGMLGYLQFRRSDAFSKNHWAVQFAWQAALVLLTLGFVFVGARAYAQDVALIESEMVNTATWVARSVPVGDVVAAHDIGALGYFDQHPLIDLAGLVSPEVVPFMRDETRLAAFLNERGVRYLIAFPDLYPDLARAGRPVFSSGGSFAPALGEQNMTVYCWSCP
jgi:hypothetical protein